MRYTMSERHSYGNGFRKARAIGIRKLRHMKHNQFCYYSGSKYKYYPARISGKAGQYTAFK